MTIGATIVALRTDLIVSNPTPTYRPKSEHQNVKSKSVHWPAFTFWLKWMDNVVSQMKSPFSPRVISVKMYEEKASVEC